MSIMHMCISTVVSWYIFHQKTECPSDITDFYNSLQYTLYETGCPETVDRTAKPRAGIANHQVAIVILSAPCECMGLLLEGKLTS